MSDERIATDAEVAEWTATEHVGYELTDRLIARVRAADALLKSTCDGSRVYVCFFCEQANGLHEGDCEYAAYRKATRGGDGE